MRDNLADTGVIATDDYQTVKRQTVQEVDKVILQRLVTAAAILKVIGINIGQDCINRLQVQEGGIALIRLGYHIFPFAEPGMGTRHIQASADNIGRVEHSFRQQVGDQAGRCRFPMGAGHRYAFPEAHQFR